MWNKLLKALLAVAFLLMLSAPPAQAQARYGLSVSDAVTANDDLTLPAGTWVYGWKIFAEAATAYANLIDAATSAEGIASNIVDEIGEATALDSTTNWFEAPIFFTNGVSVQVPSGVGTVFIYYGPQP